MSPGLVFRGPENLSEDLDELTPGEIRKALSYMEEEGLVKRHPGTPTRDAFLQPRTYTITQKGRERTHGDGRAAPTPPVQNIFNAPVGAVQTGAGSQATIVQSSTTGREEILKLLRELRAVVEEIGDDSAREILKEDLEGVEEEVRSESPKPGKTRSFIRTFLAHAPGSITASNQLLSLLEKCGVTPGP
jgi:DNA-binding PadR family transcriptional regulator